MGELARPGDTLLPDLNVVCQGIAMGTPSCEILEHKPNGGVGLCGKPSTVRLRMSFSCCGTVYIKFACNDCVALLTSDEVFGWLCDEGCNKLMRPEWTVI